MKQLILLIAVIVTSLSTIHSQEVIIDEIDWTTQSGTSGSTINGIPWNASGTDQDGNSVFGVSGDRFVFEDIEGSAACGNNDNTLDMSLVFVQNYCQARVTFEIFPRGTLNCGAANDQDVNNFTADGCPAGAEWNNTDGLEIKINNLETLEERVVKVCGTTSSTGSFLIDETFDVGQNGTAISMSIVGGTHSGGSYDIGAIEILGVPRINSSINLSLDGNNSNNSVCEGQGSFDLLTGISNAQSTYTWSLPDGSVLTGSINDGLDKLTVTNLVTSQSGTYGVTVTDANGCQLIDQIDIAVLESSDAQCQVQSSFNSINSIECSFDVLPLVDDNLIRGTWSPGHVLSDFVGQTLEFVFTPDDPGVSEYRQVITVEDVSLLDDFGTPPTIAPVFCNASSATYDLIDIFQLNYENFRLEIQGDNFLFDFIPVGATADVDAFVNEFRNISVEGLPAQENYRFKITGYTKCGSAPLDKFFFINIVDPAEPIRIDTALCGGDFIDFSGFPIYNDTVIIGEDACDTMLIANIERKPSYQVRDLVLGFGQCNEVYYHYDTIVNGQVVGFVKAPFDAPPPFGPNYVRKFTEDFSDNNYVIQARNGCDSIGRVIIDIGDNNTEFITIPDWCQSAGNYSLEFEGATFIISPDEPHVVKNIGRCRFLDITLEVLPAEIDSSGFRSFCYSDAPVTWEVAPGDFREFDETMTYPMTIELAQGANGCPATYTVDFEFVPPSRGTENVRLCPGTSFVLGGRTFNGPVTNEEVVLRNEASTGCDSIVTLNIEVVQPEVRTERTTICAEESYTFEGQIFDINNPSGLVRIPSALGCDSIVYDVDVSFFEAPDVTIDIEICEEESVFLPEYNYTIDKDNLTDDLVITTPDNCNQNIFIRATILEAKRSSLEETICGGTVFSFAGQALSETGIYHDTLQSPSTACDSIVTLTLNVRDVIPVTDMGTFTICQGGSVDILNETFTTADTYTRTLLSPNNCDSVVTFAVEVAPVISEDLGIIEICEGDMYSNLSEDFTVAGNYDIMTSTTDGCDSLVQFTLVVNPNPITDLGVIDICQGTTYTNLGETFDQAGDYEIQTSSVHSCDSTVKFTLQINAPVVGDLGVIDICQGTIYTNLGNTYDVAGAYEIQTTTADGCDSIVAFTLEINAPLVGDLGVIDICQGATHTFMGDVYDTAGDYEVATTTADGCDSIVRFTLEINAPIVGDLGVIDICQGTTYINLGNTYDVAGAYEIQTTTADGCDSIVSFTLEINAPVVGDLGVIDICQGTTYTNLGNTYDVAGAYEIQTTTADGCDSIVSFTLEINAPVVGDLGVIDICQGTTHSFMGNEYDTAGEYEVATTTADGCDSIVRFTLEINAPITFDLGVLISCPAVPIVYNNNTYDTNGSYSETFKTADGCDSIVTFEVLLQGLPVVDDIITICAGESYSVFGVSYTETTDIIVTEAGGAASGCDSTVHLFLTVLEEKTATEVFDICPGTSFDYEGITFDQAVQDQPVVLQGSDQCDSTVFVTVNVLQTDVVDLGQVELCNGESISIGSTEITDLGTHQVTLQNSVGCDSIVSVELVRPAAVTLQETLSICPGTSLVINGQEITTSGVYEETISQPNTCDTIISYDVFVAPVIDTTFLPTEFYCGGESVEIEGQTYTTTGNHIVSFTTDNNCDSIVVYSLEFSTDNTSTMVEVTCNNQPFEFNGQTFAATGVYPITFERPGECDSVVILDLTVNEAFMSDMGTRQMCFGNTLQIGRHVITQSGDYNLSFTAQNGCDSTVSLTVITVDEIMVDLGVIQICEGTSYTFGDQELTEAGTYSNMSLTTQSMCDSMTLVEIEILEELSIEIENLIGSCEGGANGSFVISNVPGATPPFNVFGLDGIQQINSLPYTVTGLGQGTYNFELEDAKGCLIFGDATITDDRENAVGITSITIDPIGQYELIVDYSGQIATIEWRDDEGLSCYDCPNPTVDISETTTFKVTVTDVEGCMSMAEITLSVDGIGNVYFPNIINPNSAQGNHRFYPQTEDGLEAEYDLYVFDRWGNKVYAQEGAFVNDIEFGWNGRYQDNRINAGVFVYSVRIYKANGITETYKGDVTVIE